MEEESEGGNDDYFYPSDFEEDSQYVLGVDNMVQGAQEYLHVQDSSSFQEPFFNMLDFESDTENIEDVEELGSLYEDMYMEFNEDLKGVHEGSNCEHCGSATNNIHFIGDISPLPSFLNVSIEAFPKHVVFTLASKKLMLQCLQTRRISMFEEIRECDPSFCPLPTYHGRVVHVDDVFHTIQRWRKLHSTLQVIER